MSLSLKINNSCGNSLSLFLNILQSNSLDKIKMLTPKSLRTVTPIAVFKRSSQLIGPWIKLSTLFVITPIFVIHLKHLNS